MTVKAPQGKDANPNPDGTSETVGQLAKRLSVSKPTVWNWIKNGVTIDGRKVRLNAKRFGWKWFISPEAWAQFERDCNPEYQPIPETPAQTARRLRNDAREAAELLGTSLPETPTQTARRAADAKRG